VLATTETRAGWFTPQKVTGPPLFVEHRLGFAGEFLLALVVLRCTAMAGVRRFQDLVAWQLCTELRERLFEMTKSGPSSRDFSFCDQVRRAAKNAPALIAEGFVRFTIPEFIRYLRMARSELGEIENALEHAKVERLFTEDQLNAANTLFRRSMATTTNLMKSKLRQLAADESNQKRRRRKTP
jgi:four helix bundle protein